MSLLIGLVFVFFPLCKLAAPFLNPYNCQLLLKKKDLYSIKLSEILIFTEYPYYNDNKNWSEAYVMCVHINVDTLKHTHFKGS